MGKKNSGGIGAAIAVATIAVLIILYILINKAFFA